MGRFYFGLIAILTMLVTAPVSAQSQPTVHLLVAGNRADKTIGIGVGGNVALLQSFADDIRRAGFRVEEHAALDPAFSCTSIKKLLDDVHPSADDVVIFYYSGHGYRTQNTTGLYPEFDCRVAAADSFLGLTSAVQILTQKPTPPRLTIAIADACNTQFVVPPFGTRGLISPDQLVAGLKHLLGDFKGTILVAAAKPGDFAYYRTFPPAMGFFTDRFLASVRNEALSNQGAANWDAVRAAAVKPIVVGPDYAPQEPVMEMRLTPTMH